ncbi:MAG TPA: nuclear transport factor 2 family protein [Planctomycetota bacterium]|nr:nuclear transport factor 2 family protein [Planctomycetota bacterium]
MLNAQVDAWNRADLDGFMEGYASSEHLVFMTPEGSTRGHAETLARYRRSYDRPDRFGVLTFDALEFSALDGDTAVVDGRWRLRRAADAPAGRFLLVVRRLPEGWRVVSDYTVSDP